MKLQVKARRLREVLEKGSKEHESASKSNEIVGELLEKGSKKRETAGNSNESGRGIREGKHVT